MSFDLSEENFIMFAIKHYDNKNCTGLDEFFDDLHRFKYLKRLLKNQQWMNWRVIVLH